MVNFDTKICYDHLNECLSRLLLIYAFYPDLAENQVEFHSLYMLFNLGESDGCGRILPLSSWQLLKDLWRLMFDRVIMFITSSYLG